MSKSVRRRACGQITRQRYSPPPLWSEGRASHAALLQSPSASEEQMSGSRPRRPLHRRVHVSWRGDRTGCLCIGPRAPARRHAEVALAHVMHDSSHCRAPVRPRIISHFSAALSPPDASGALRRLTSPGRRGLSRLSCAALYDMLFEKDWVSSRPAHRAARGARRAGHQPVGRGSCATYLLVGRYANYLYRADKAHLAPESPASVVDLVDCDG